VGIEALSRGAAFARLTDLNRAPLDTIKLNLENTQLAGRAEVRRADAFKLLTERPDRQFHYVYIAPPQYQGHWQRALLSLDANPTWLAGDAWAVIQIDPREYEPQALAHLREFDVRRYGTTMLAFFDRAES
jgi:16S rRNA (guanine966-N2)-methyltransferase